MHDMDEALFELQGRWSKASIKLAVYSQLLRSLNKSSIVADDLRNCWPSLI